MPFQDIAALTLPSVLYQLCSFQFIAAYKNLVSDVTQ